MEKLNETEMLQIRKELRGRRWWRASDAWSLILCLITLIAVLILASRGLI